MPQFQINFNVYVHKKPIQMSGIGVIHCNIIRILRMFLIAKAIDRTSERACIGDFLNEYIRSPPDLMV
jgi:hypothetical protein